VVKKDKKGNKAGKAEAGREKGNAQAVVSQPEP
jgi:hypothetical protein